MNIPESEKDGKFNGSGLGRLVRAFYCSLAGVRAAWNNEAAFRQELIFCAVMLPIAMISGQTGMEKALLISCLFLILIIEIVNTAVEAAIDRIGPQLHPFSKLAKDMGSAAVLLSFVNWGVVWFFVLLT